MNAAKIKFQYHRCLLIKLIPNGKLANWPFGNCPHGKHAGNTDVSQISFTVYAALGRRTKAISYPSFTTFRDSNFS